MKPLAFLRPLWTGPVRDRAWAWLLVLALLLLVWSIPFSVTQVLEWRRGVPDEYLNQHARLAVGSMGSVLMAVTLILLLARRRILMWVFIAADIGMLVWSKQLH